MISIIPDPQNPNRLALSVSVTIYLDRMLGDVLSEEVGDAIRAQAVKDLKGNPEVKKRIAEAATLKLLEMLGAAESVKA